MKGPWATVTLIKIINEPKLIMEHENDTYTNQDAQMKGETKLMKTGWRDI